jgi:hypothetical protein
VSGDLEGATLLATYMEGFWGMGATVASHGVTHEVGVGGGGKPGAGKTKKEREQAMLEGGLGVRIETRLDELLQRAKTLLEENRLEVLAVAHALETNKTVTGEDIEAIIEGRHGALLDGRPYHDPRFLEEAEAYHVEAVKAHHEHARVSMPIPALHPVIESVASTVAGGGDGNGAGAPTAVAPLPIHQPAAGVEQTPADGEDGSTEQPREDGDG